MGSEEILAQLTDIVREVLEDETLVLRPDMTAEDVPGWDSMAHINIIVASEIQFGIKFRAAETEELRDVGGFVELIEAKLP
ncbi:MAG: acyl carrier protein [Sphingomonadales bacterium]|jgi:acyl carrier protein|nr:acyl carrier protein [Sphingomonadales bacterium]MEA3036362.1 acyl carrier protein [Sphingomonadales bacterium]